MFSWLIQLRYPGTAICLREGLDDITRKLEFLGLLINLNKDEMSEVYERYQEKIDKISEREVTYEEKFNISLSLMPSFKKLRLDYRKTALTSIDNFEMKKIKSLEVA